MALTKCKECNEEISTKAEKCPKCGSPKKKQTSIFTWTILVVFILWGFGYFSGNSNQPTTASNISTSKPEPTPQEIAKGKLKLDYTWEKVGFDNIMEANFTVTNGNEKEIKDIEISCTHYAKSGTAIDSNNRIIYEIIPANSKKTFKKFNMGFIHSQAEKTGCMITSFKI